MKIKSQIQFERELGDVTANVSANVSKHWGRLECSDFESDIALSRDEQDEAEDKLCEEARYHGHIPEEEPEAQRYST